MKRTRSEEIKHYLVNGIAMIAILVGGIFLYHHLTQVELTLVNSTGSPIRDVQVLKHTRRYFLGNVGPNGQRVVSFPVRNDTGYVLTFVPINKHRRYYNCPEYLYPGLHIRWTILKDGTVMGETATLPGNWIGDPRVFDPAKGGKPQMFGQKSAKTASLTHKA